MFDLYQLDRINTISDVKILVFSSSSSSSFKVNKPSSISLVVFNGLK